MKFICIIVIITIIRINCFIIHKDSTIKYHVALTAQKTRYKS